MLKRIRDKISAYLKTQADRIMAGKSVRSLVLFLVIFFSLLLGLANAVRGIERGLLWSAIWIALLLGFLLAHRRLSGWLGALIASLMGLLWTSIRVTEQFGTIWGILRALLVFLWRTLWRNPLADSAKLQSLLLVLDHAQRDLISRLGIWIQSNLTDPTLAAYDPLVVAFVWGLITWTISVWAGWAIWRRQQPLLSVLPAVGVLAVILAFVFGRIIYLMPMVVAMLMLKAQFEGDRRLEGWQQQGMSFASNISKEITRTAFAVSSTLVIFAALIPSIYSNRIVALVWNIYQGGDVVDEITYALGLEPRAVARGEDPFWSIGSVALPTERLINAAPQLGDQVVMTVRVQEFLPNAALQPAGNEKTYYWRGRIYAAYTGRGWSTGELHKEDYDAGEKVISGTSNDQPPGLQTLTRQEVQFVASAGSGLIYVAGDLVSVDRDFQVAWQISPSVPDEFDDLVGASLDEKSRKTYRADALSPIFGEDDLRETTAAYPQWIVDRYLNLPESVPERVHTLAAELTADYTHPYDRALALERYLRDFPYTLDVPSPPTDQDIADYFLFDLQRGYCDYYATSMVVMARSIGIPARLATGYIGGNLQAEGQYQVTEDLAHSWPQLYFSGYGWVDFEPTGGRDALLRPEGSLAEQVAAESPVEGQLEPILAQRTRTNWRLGSGVGLGLMLFFVGSIAAWAWADSWQLRIAAPNEALRKIFHRLYRYGPRLDLPDQQGSTPTEFSDSLNKTLMQKATQRVFKTSLDSLFGRVLNIELSAFPQALDELHQLTSLHNRAAYSQIELTNSDGQRAIQLWLRLRRWLAYVWFQNRVIKIRYN